MSLPDRPERDADIGAQISYLATSEGGRVHAAHSGYRPTHDFGLGYLSDAHHYYPNGPIAPGQTGEALLWFLNATVHEQRLFPGFQFTVQEGGRLVGSGVVTRVLDQRLQKPDIPPSPG